MTTAIKCLLGTNLVLELVESRSDPKVEVTGLTRE